MSLFPPDVQAVMVEPMANGMKLSSATAAIVSDGMGSGYWLATNWHVLSGRHSVTDEILHKSGATPTELLVHMTTSNLSVRVPITLALRDEGNDALWLEHPIRGRRVDVGVVPLPSEFNGHVRHWLGVHDQNSKIWIAVSERLSVVGFPFGITAGMGLPIWVQGHVATHIDLDFDGEPCFLIDARTRDGQSGSPVVFYSTSGIYPAAWGGSVLAEQKGEMRFMGIYSGRINEQSDLGRVWKPSAVHEIIVGGKRSKSL